MATKKVSGSTGRKTATKTTKAPSAMAQAAAEAAMTAVPVVEKRTPTHEDVAQLAQQYWIERGRPYGSAEVDWLRAEATLHA